MKAKKSWGKKIVRSLLFILAFGFSGQAVVAQAGTVSGSGETNQMATIADINFRDPILLKQAGNVLDLYFRLENNYPQSESGIRYGVQLIKDKAVFDEKVYADDILSIESNASIQKIFSYTAPGYLSGDFELWLVAKNESGLPLATFKLEKLLTLKGDREYLEIDQNSCVLKIDGEAGDKKYTLMQGVSLKAEETLKLSCEATSHFKEFTIVAPIFNTFERTLFGNLVDKDKKGEEITFQLGEKKTIEFTIEKPSIPQAYEVRLDLMRTSGDISSLAAPIIFHYVIAGESATIQKLDLDNVAYKKGETINATLLWSGSADNFVGSRMGATENGPVGLNISISNQLGRECANSLEQKLEPNGEAKLALIADTDCVDPKVKVILKNEQGIVLAQKEFNFLKDKKIIPQKSSTRDAWVIGGLIILLIIILTLLWKRKKKSNFPVAKALALLVLALFGLSFGKAQALTLSNTSYNNWTHVVLNINLDKSVYDPGEQITTTTTGYAQIMDCANHDNNGVALSGGTGSCYKNPIFWYGQSILGGGYVGVNVSDSTCSAPTTPGTQRYSFNFSLTGEGANRDSGSGDIYYSVADNTPDPTCNISFNNNAYNVGDWGSLTWTSDGTSGELYCGGAGSVNDHNAGANRSNYGIQLAQTGAASCVLTVHKGTKTSVCSTQTSVVAPVVPSPEGKIWFVNGLIYKVGQSGTVQWETQNAKTAKLHCEGVPIDTVDLADAPVNGTHGMRFNRAGFVLCKLIVSNGVEGSNLEISSSLINNSLAYLEQGQTAFAASNTSVAIALSVTVEVAECVNTCSGSCVASNPNNSMIPTAGECCNASMACYACPPNTKWNGYSCASNAPACECTNGPFSGGGSCSAGEACDGCHCTLKPTPTPTPTPTCVPDTSCTTSGFCMKGSCWDPSCKQWIPCTPKPTPAPDPCGGTPSCAVNIITDNRGYQYRIGDTCSGGSFCDGCNCQGQCGCGSMPELYCSTQTYNGLCGETCYGTKNCVPACVPTSPNCDVNTCEGSTCNDGCHTLSGKKPKECLAITCNAGDCGMKTGSGTCGAVCPSKDCGPCNSGNWQEVAP